MPSRTRDSGPCDAVCLEGIAAKLAHYADTDWPQLDYLLNIIKDECPAAFAELIHWASEEITESYIEFLTTQWARQGARVCGRPGPAS